MLFYVCQLVLLLVRCRLLSAISRRQLSMVAAVVFVGASLSVIAWPIEVDADSEGVCIYESPVVQVLQVAVMGMCASVVVWLLYTFLRVRRSVHAGGRHASSLVLPSSTTLGTMRGAFPPSPVTVPETAITRRGHVRVPSSLSLAVRNDERLPARAANATACAAGVTSGDDSDALPVNRRITIRTSSSRNVMTTSGQRKSSSTPAAAAARKLSITHSPRVAVQDETIHEHDQQQPQEQQRMRPAITVDTDAPLYAVPKRLVQSARNSTPVNSKNRRHSILNSASDAASMSLATQSQGGRQRRGRQRHWQRRRRQRTVRSARPFAQQWWAMDLVAMTTATSFVILLFVALAPSRTFFKYEKTILLIIDELVTSAVCVALLRRALSSPTRSRASTTLARPSSGASSHLDSTNVRAERLRQLHERFRSSGQQQKQPAAVMSD
eukprot:TRINITY_DN33811_c0_g1_i2.p1 TRINITY_DN33811_c0_g1~~TRINITY_DN33811_c0_g1_i2.p1  ORF type:complete len:439 (+),score=129.53 TRINITY_DN33811_c0_g1_i2:333-1649(+)